jgi:ketosteroid isomerase-like protein
MPDTALAPQDGAVTMALLAAIAASFNSRDADRIAAHFTEDAVFFMASGPEPEGRAVAGRAAIRQVLADRFRLIPDMHWAIEHEYVAGHRAVSVWRVTGKGTDGTVLNCRGCDLYEFRGALICRKDTYWKMVRPDPAGRSPLLP